MRSQAPLIFPLGKVRLVYTTAGSPAVTAQLFDCDSLCIIEAAAGFSPAGFGYYYLDGVYDSPRRIYVLISEDGVPTLRFLLRVVVNVSHVRSGA